jgi:hypothetical protein
MNDLPVLRTDMNKQARKGPRSRTDLNGSGYPDMELRIRRLGFESLRARPGRRPLPSMDGALSLTRMLTVASDGGRYRVSGDVGGLGELVADGVGIHAQNLLAQGLPPIRLITSSRERPCCMHHSSR